MAVVQNTVHFVFGHTSPDHLVGAMSVKDWLLPIVVFQVHEKPFFLLIVKFRRDYLGYQIIRPVQQAVPCLLGLILRGLNESTCWTVPAHLKDGPSRAGPWTPTDWPGMAHKPGRLAVSAGRADGAVPAGRANGRAGGLAYIKFFF